MRTLRCSTARAPDSGGASRRAFLDGIVISVVGWILTEIGLGENAPGVNVVVTLAC